MDDFFEAYVRGDLSYDDLMVIFGAELENAARAVPRQVARASNVFSLDRFSDAEVRLFFRFERSDLPRLLHLFGVPQFVRNEGYRVPNMTALCILLRRLAYPNRLGDLESFFGMSKSALSAIARVMVTFVNDAKGHRLKELRDNQWLDWQRLEVYAAAVEGKGAALNNCWAFIDGTGRRICRPTHDQETYYSGHKRHHCLKYQSILTPDGLIVNLQGPFHGRRHDAGVWTGCGVQDQIQHLCVTPERTFVIFGDPAYPVSRILCAPYPSANEQPHAVAFNRSMSKVRQAVEWGFAKVIQQFAFVDFCKNQKIELQDVGGMYNCAVLLTNCHTCLYGSQASQYFDCGPPSLEEYLQ